MSRIEYTNNVTSSTGEENKLSLQTNYSDFEPAKIDFLPNTYSHKTKIDLVVKKDLVNMMVEDMRSFFQYLPSPETAEQDYRKRYTKNYVILSKAFPDFPKLLSRAKVHEVVLYNTLRVAHMGREGLKESLRICEQLGVTNFLSFLHIWSTVEHHIDTPSPSSSPFRYKESALPRVFSKQKFEECMQHFGKGELQKIFVVSYDNMSREQASRAGLGHPYSNQEHNIIKYCTTHLVNKTSLGIGYAFTSLYEGSHSHILLDLSSDINYLLSQTNMTIEDMLALQSDDDTKFSYIDLLKLIGILQHSFYSHNKSVSDQIYLLTKDKECDISLSKIFSKENILRYVVNNAGILDVAKYNVFEKSAQFLNGYLKKPIKASIDESHLQSYMKQKQEEFNKAQEAAAIEAKKAAKKLAIQNRKDARDGRNYHIIKSLTSVLAPSEISESGILSSNMITNSLGNTKADGVSFARQYHDIVKKLAQEYKGLFSVGGKIHFPKSIPQEKLDKFVAHYKFPSSPFKMIHANTSFLLPPSQYPEEIQFMIQCLQQHGLLEDDPQLQICVPGRMPNALGGILASSLILLSNYHTEYTQESFAPTVFGENDFSTTHDEQTGRMMVTYDAGVYDDRFKRNTPGVVGRTDVLLLKDAHLIPKAQVIGSLLSQTEYDGRFADLGVEFIKEYCDLLVKHNMETVVASPWIYDRNGGNSADKLKAHINAVNKVSEKQYIDWMVYHSTKQTRGLMVFDVYKLLYKYKEKIKSRQQSF